ncbi:MAG: L-fucose/L-arabinose isomerase family protein [Caldilineales bacterium]|nr:L-fucose/L-arabinose isomerase family protein [Caldilineales bacterium]
MTVEQKPITLGVIVGNRGFFPSHLCETGRSTILRVLAEEGINAIALSPDETEYGSVESISDARKCADLFRQYRDDIDGVLVTLPNFGDERAVANTLRWAELDVPVLIHAFPDEVGKMDLANRRDSFCGKMSACNNLKQYNIKYSLTSLHTVDPESESFRTDLRKFAKVCRVVGGLKGARFGQLGARPPAFNTVRYSEKLLERAGISVETLDLSDVYGRIEALGDDDARVQGKLSQIKAYIVGKDVPDLSYMKMAKLGVVIDEWMTDNKLVGSAIQCWTSLEEYFGIVPCTVMSMMSNELMSSACETDIVGTIAMYAMGLASGKPSAIVDWNNNYGEDPDKAVIFHCSNLPKDVFVEQSLIPADIPVMQYQDIISGTVGKENAFGSIDGRVKAEPFTYCRVSTDDFNGKIIAYIGEGELTDDPLSTFGGRGVVEVPNMQGLLAYICENGYEHHVSINLSEVADVLEEAFSKYLGWETYYHAKGFKKGDVDLSFLQDVPGLKSIVASLKKAL